MSTYSRVKRSRERLLNGVTFAHVEIPRSLSETLIRSGYLSEPDCRDPKKAGEAFLRFWIENYKNL